MDLEWYELSPNLTYEVSKFVSEPLGKRFSRLIHEYMLFSVAPCGGDIAVTSDKTKFVNVRQDDSTVHSIVIFGNDGEIKHIVRIKDPNEVGPRLIMIAYLKDEHLIALFEKGELWIIEPFTANVKKTSIIGLQQGELIQQAKQFDCGFAFRTRTNRFYYVLSAHTPQCQPFVSVSEDIVEFEKELYWNVFGPKQLISERVELHVTHPSAGIIQVIEGEKKAYFFNHQKAAHGVEGRLPHIRGVRFISNLSPNKRLISYFVADPIYKDNPGEAAKRKKGEPEPKRTVIGYNFKVIICPSLIAEGLDASRFRVIDLPTLNIETQLNPKMQPVTLKWCGSKAVILQLKNWDLLMLGIDGSILPIERNRVEKEKWNLIKEEIDGARIISKKKNRILRLLPEPFINVFKTSSKEPGKFLYQAYEAFQSQQPLQNDEIRRDKQRLAKAVEDCLKCCKFQLDYSMLTKLLKASVYGKAFLPPNSLANNNEILEITRILRAVHYLRQKQRFITYQQFVSLTDEQLLKMLLAHREHYYAFELHRYLKKDQAFRLAIFTNWACCKVKDQDATDNEVCEAIKKKITDEKGVSFAEISYRAIELGRSELAMKLLECEPSLSKKVPLILWLASREPAESCYPFYRRAVQDAIRSRDINLQYLCIMKIQASGRLGQYELFELFSTEIEGRMALLNFYRAFDTGALLSYFKYLERNESLIMEYLRKGLAEKKYDAAQKLILTSLQQLQGWQQSPYAIQWRRESFKKVYEHFCQFLKANPNIQYRDNPLKPVAICKQLEMFVAKSDEEGVNDMKSAYRISDKRVILMKIKSLIDKAKYIELVEYLQRHADKQSIPLQMVADILFQKEEPVWAMKVFSRMGNKQREEQYTLLNRIGRVKEAIELAAQRRDIKGLQEIQQAVPDPAKQAMAAEAIARLKKK